jgi:hypothetical protein
MNSLRAIAICAVISTCAHAVPQRAASKTRNPNPDTVIVTGRVLYKNGIPVENAEINVYGLNGIAPPPVLTDREGRYRVVYRPFGEAVVSASKTAEGFPEATMASCGRKSCTTSMRSIDMKPGTLAENVDLVFGDPESIVTFHVQDPTSGRPIENARILVDWPEKCNCTTSRIIPNDGVFNLVTPDHAVQVKISAPGRKDWYWKAEAAATISSAKPTTKRTDMIVPLPETSQ